MSRDIQRERIDIKGVVQGVGFRPFVYRNAVKRDLKGFVMNTSRGVEIEVEGEGEVITHFVNAIKTESPSQSRITSLITKTINPKGELEFKIIPSNRQKERSVLITPDIGTCAECRQELFDPQDRRYHYPFINCTNCGPRYTIIKDIPYDRPKTTMAEFKMCTQCRSEYKDPLHRRFHAQPNVCPVCGPHIWLSDSSGKKIAEKEVIAKTVSLLKQGKILAVKGLGGFHLACDAKNNKAVVRLRQRKGREEKPFAVMIDNPDSIQRIAKLDRQESELLQSPEKPIILLRKSKKYDLSPQVAPGNKYIGVMLPYTPLHYLLFNDTLDVLVMTSGNISDEPIAKSNKEALGKLKGIADYFLLHNRKIQTRADDSVTRFIGRIPRPIRRSRGYVPFPIFLRSPSPSVLAVGAELKSCFCLTRNDQAFLSQHIGDLENSETLSFFTETIEHMEHILEIKPEAIIHDLHPDYLSTKWALTKEGLPHIAVQHHHAHAVACLADNGRDDKVIGLIMDGVGYGADGNIWGGE
ncbi:MAG: carbamoyltransferase HypF, partial [bacterium]